ncbi:hypothetical protein Hanom_Chr01g00080821 [Helianthus anomalus]
MAYSCKVVTCISYLFATPTSFKDSILQPKQTCFHKMNLILHDNWIRGSLVSWNYSTNSWMVTRLKSPARLVNTGVVEAEPKEVTKEVDDIEITSGSPLPGVKPQELDDVIMIPKETIDILKDQVFGFNNFFITSQESYRVTKRSSCRSV